MDDTSYGMISLWHASTLSCEFEKICLCSGKRRKFELHCISMLSEPRGAKFNVAIVSGV